MVESNMSDLVRRLRQQLSMTQEEFAHALGITVGTVNRWENRRFRPSKLARMTLQEFARRNGLEIAEDNSPSNGGHPGTRT